MSNNCEINDPKKSSIGADPKEVIDVVGGNNIVVQTVETADKKTFIVNYQAYQAPTINTTVDIGISKVGVNIPLVNFTGNIVEGTGSILSRSMVPDKGLDLSQPFAWQETNVLGTEPGLWPQFSGEPTKITAQDDKPTTVVSEVGVEFRHLFYVGYSIEDALTESQIKGLVNQDLLTNIKSKYGTYVYNYSVVPVYIYWVFPGDTPGFTSAFEGPLPVPLKLDLPNVTVTDEGIAKSYRIIRTANKTKLTNAEITIQ